MTLEDALSEIETLKAGNESLAKKNSEILDEMKQERKKNRDSDIDSTKYYELQDKFDDLKESSKKMEHDLKGRDKELAKLTESNSGLNANLHNVIVDGGLADTLAKAGVLPHFMDAAKALLRPQATIVDNKAVVGEQPLSDFVTEWAGEAGKHYIGAADNSGGGAGGNKGGAGNHQDMSNLSAGEKMKLGRQKQA